MLFIDIFRLLVKPLIAIKCSGNKRRIPVIVLLFIGQQPARTARKIKWVKGGVFLRECAEIVDCEGIWVEN